MNKKAKIGEIWLEVILFLQKNVKNGINSAFDIDFIGDLIYNKITERKCY